MTCVRRNLNNRTCCNSWQKGIRTINNQYPDDNREFEIAAGNGISVVPITAGILITNTSAASSFVEGRNIDITPSGTDLQISVTDEPEFDGLTINGTSTFNGDIIQNGAAYETHAEKIYTTNDYVIMRDGAVAGLAAGDYSGFQVKLYDGVNDGRLVIDNAGTARVGDVGDEEPLLTRDESADLTDGNLLEWDGTNYKAVDSGVDVATINGKVSGTGNIGSDTYPIKVVAGVATAGTRGIPRTISGTTTSVTTQAGNSNTINVTLSGFTSTPVISITPNGLPPGIGDMVWALTNITSTSFTISLYNLGASAATMSFYYTAIGV